MAIRDVFRIYDQTIFDWVKLFTTEGHSPVVVFAEPDRPFAGLDDPDLDEELRSQMMRSNIIVAVTRQDPQYNPKLHSQTGIIPLTKLIEHDYVIGSKPPQPYILPYQLDVRCRNRTTANLWSQWIYFKFNPYVCWYINFGLWGRKQIQSILRSFVDNSDLDTGESERWIRWTIRFDILNAWMFPIPETSDDVPDMFGMLERYRIVKKVHVEVYKSNETPPSFDPAIPGTELIDVVRREIVETSVDVPVESK